MLHVYQGPIGYARSTLAALFLYHTNADYLLFVDRDNAFSLQMWDALKGVAGDLVCVPYVSRHEYGGQNHWNVKYSADMVHNPSIRTAANSARLWTVTGAGTGMMRISRKALETICKQSPGVRCWNDQYKMVMYHVFADTFSSEPQYGPHDKDVVAPEPYVVHDDYGFCQRAKALGINTEVLVDFWSDHAGIKPDCSLAEGLWGKGK